MPELAPGDIFVNHRIVGLAGRGGMGVVYRAIDLDLDRVVALKVITPALADDPDFRARFVAESKSAAAIEHPHVIPLYYSGEREGVLFIVMRFVDGPDLRALVRAEGLLEPERAANIIAQIGGALDAAHAHGLVHRDVKPANVLLGEDEHAYLTDFGLTKREASTGGVSRSGGWVGTLGFVAPEQIRGERVDARTDVYALGCVLVHALTGGAPYLRDSDEATLWAHLNAAPPVDRVPAEFAAVVERALSKDPDDRFPSAGDLGRAALAAAGRSGSIGPERNVGRGEAAPDGTPQTEATARVGTVPHEGETHVSPPDPTRSPGDSPGTGGATALTAGGGGPRGFAARVRTRGVLAAAALLVVAVVATILLAGGGDDATSTGNTNTATTTTRTHPTEVGAPITNVTRPNGITVSKHRVWVLSNSDGKVLVLDAQTGETKRQVDIGDGGTGIAAGFGSIWAVKAAKGAHSLLRLNPSTGRRVGSAIQIAYPGLPNIVAVGEGAVWVGVRKAGHRDGSGESLVRVDRNGGGQEAIPIPGGVGDIAVGEGAVWITTSHGGNVIRVNPGNVHNVRTIKVGDGLDGIAVGEGAVWVADRDGKSLRRVNPTSFNVRRVALGVAPARVTVGGGSVWVTARAANTLFRIRPQPLEIRERIPTGVEPFALDVSEGSSVWLTLIDQGGGAVQRVRFYR